MRSVFDNISLQSRTVTLRPHDLLLLHLWVILFCGYISVNLLVLHMMGANWRSTCLGNQAVVLLPVDWEESCLFFKCLHRCLFLFIVGLSKVDLWFLLFLLGLLLLAKLRNVLVNFILKAMAQSEWVFTYHYFYGFLNLGVCVSYFFRKCEFLMFLVQQRIRLFYICGLDFFGRTEHQKVIVLHLRKAWVDRAPNTWVSFYLLNRKHIY